MKKVIIYSPPSRGRAPARSRGEAIVMVVMMIVRDARVKDSSAGTVLLNCCTHFF